MGFELLNVLWNLGWYNIYFKILGCLSKAK